VNARGEPHLVPVGFIYNAEHDSIDIGSRQPGLTASRKFRDAQATGRVVFLVDDVLVTDQGPQIRAIEIRGIGETHATGGEHIGPDFEPPFIRIRPRRIISWGINTPGYQPESRTAE
jgi:PPOX class F420-dependent enzyme/OxyR family protein